jgi:uncharacterized membrane protein YedE/YeeE
MKGIAIALGCGALFGFGLALSGMVEPVRVRGFLDVTGAWDPTLMFVMGGAVMVTGLAYPLVLRRARPILGEKFWLPEREDVDLRLVAGAVIFGVGWGIGGLCPGPALAALALGSPGVWIFVAAMVVGIVAHRVLVESSD